MQRVNRSVRLKNNLKPRWALNGGKINRDQRGV